MKLILMAAVVFALGGIGSAKAGCIPTYWDDCGGSLSYSQPGAYDRDFSQPYASPGVPLLAPKTFESWRTAQPGDSLLSDPRERYVPQAGQPLLID